MNEFYETCYAAIRSQGTAIARTIADNDHSPADILQDKDTVIFMGCGDSYAVADFGKWCMQSAGMKSLCLSPDELRYVPLDSGKVVVGISASGRSLVTIDALARARAIGATTALLTDNPKGAAAEHADELWVTKSSVPTYDTSPSAPTTAAMAYLLRVLSAFDSIYGHALDQDLSRLENLDDKTLVWADQEGKIVSELTCQDHPIYLISEGPNYVAAQIGMMKFNEFSITRGIASLREEFCHHHNLSLKGEESAVLVTDTAQSDQNDDYLRVLKDTLGLRTYQLESPEFLALETPLAQAIPNCFVLQLAAFHGALRLNPEKSQFNEPNASAFRIY